MTEVNTVVEKPAENPLEGMSQQDIQALLEYRSNLLMDLGKAYAALVEALYKLPIHVVYRQQSFLFLDTAEMWAKKGIDNVWNLPEGDEPVVEPVEAPAE